MKRPSWPTIILGFLNIIAAGFLMVLASRAFYARVAWTRHLDDGRMARDGFVRFGETEATDETAKLIDGLSDAGKKAVEQWQSRYARRRATGEVLFEPLKNSIAKLRVDSPEAQELAKNLGPLDFTKLMENHYQLRHPELRSEEQQVAQKKATVLFVRETYNKAIAQLTIEIASLTERLQAEKDRTQLQLVENAERAKELSTVMAELEEAIAARNLAEGHLRDFENHLARTRATGDRLIKQNGTLEEQIRTREGVAAPRGGE